MVRQPKKSAASAEEVAIPQMLYTPLMPTELNETPPAAEHRPDDEYANLITHAVGFVLSVAGSIVLMTLVIQNRPAIQIVACGIYCSSLMGLYAASTLSHMFHDLAWRRFFRTLDQACIYLLIAGSFTPFSVVFLWHQWWPVLLGVMWLLALFGVALVLRMRNLTPAAKITYGLLGWLPVISLKMLFDAAPLPIVICVVGGGLFYSFGAVFLRYDQFITSHKLRKNANRALASSWLNEPFRWCSTWKSTSSSDLARPS